MASGSRGRGYRTRSLRMRASAGRSDDVAFPEPDPQFVGVSTAGLLEHLRRRCRAPGFEGAARVLAELERRIDDKSEDRIHAGDDTVRAMRDSIKALERRGATAQALIDRATETEARLWMEVGEQKRTAAAMARSHKAALEALNASHQAALEALEASHQAALEIHRRASESEASLQTKIQEMERKAAGVEDDHRAEIEALKSRAAKAVADRMEEITRRHRVTMDLQTLLHNSTTEVQKRADLLEGSHGDQVFALERSRVAQMEARLKDAIASRDRMAGDFEARIDAIAGEAERAARADATNRIRTEALERMLVDANERLSDALRKQQEAAAEIGGEIGCGGGEVASLLRGIQEDERTIAELKVRLAKTRVMEAYGQQ